MYLLETFLLTSAFYRSIIMLGGIEVNVDKRIKILRKELDLTLEKFGEKLGVKKAAVSKWENSGNITEQMFKAICKIFNVNETWLRTGKEDMFNQETPFDFNEFLKKQEASNLEIEIIKLFFNMNIDIRRKLIANLKEIFESEAANKQFISTDEGEQTLNENKQSEFNLENMDSYQLLAIIDQSSKELKKRELKTAQQKN